MPSSSVTPWWPEVPQPCSSHLDDHVPLFCLTQVTSWLRLTARKTEKWDEEYEKRQGWNTSKVYWGWKHYTEGTGIALRPKKKEYGAEGMAKPGCYRRLGIRWWKLWVGWGNVCVHVCAWACARRQPSPRRTVEEKVMNWEREKKEKNRTESILERKRKKLWIFFFNNLVHIFSFDS